MLKRLLLVKKNKHSRKTFTSQYENGVEMAYESEGAEEPFYTDCLICDDFVKPTVEMQSVLSYC